MTHELDRERVCSNVGVPTMARLRLWAKSIQDAYQPICPSVRVLLGGSALLTKDWRDLDVIIGFTQADYDKISTEALWWHHAAAWSLYASEVVGARVEARPCTFSGINWPKPLLDLTNGNSWHGLV